MHGSRFALRSPRKLFLNHAELWIGSFAVAVAGGTLMLLQPAFGEPWRAAMAANAINGGLHAV